jgi:hypothetical protein
MDLSFWTNVGIAGAVIVVVQLFLKHLKSERRACEQCRSEHAEVSHEFGRIISNHMVHETEAHARLAEAIRSLEEVVREALQSRPDAGR